MRVFVAIDLPDEIKARLHEISSALFTYGVAPVDSDLYHITLQFLGNVKESELDAIDKALGNVTRRKFSLSVEGVSFFSPKFLRVVFAGVSNGGSDAVGLYNEICGALSAHGVKYEKEHDYKPHATIARVKSAKNRNEIMNVIHEYRERRFGSFEVSEFVLKESVNVNGKVIYKSIRGYALL